jgi:hypothetical protein
MFGQRLAVCAAAFSLVTGVMAWSATQSATGVALASSCSSRSDGACDTKAARAEDVREAQGEQQCRADHTEQFCQDKARAEDQEEAATECDEEGNRDGNSDCEPYGANRESGDNRVHISAIDDASKSLSRAGFDPGVIGTAASILLVVGTLLTVAVGRRRIGRSKLEAP